jgi:hypothetical protein
MLSQEYQKEDIKSLVRVELGVKIALDGLLDFEDDFDEFFSKCEIRDLLDLVTLIYGYMKRLPGLPDSHHQDWAAETNRILAEENLAYRVATDGIVHPFVDAEFEINRASAVDALSAPRFGEARADFEAAFRHLRDGNGKEAIRMMYPAVEVAAKVLFPRAFARLMPNEVDRHFKPAVERRYTGNEPAIAAGRSLLDGMKNWIVAAQPYRHGQEQQEPAEPPMGFVIAHLSTGAIYLRWMIELCADE